MMWHGVRALAALSIACLLSGCGGGSVSISGRARDSVPTDPHPLLQKIEQSLSDVERTKELLLSLNGADPLRFDWPLFWKELSRRPYRKTLFEKQKAVLYEIHQLHCEAFPEFAQFWLAVDGDLNVIVGERRRCAQSLPPEVVGAVIDSVSGRVNVVDGKLLESTLEFLQLELRNGSGSSRWNRAMEGRLNGLEAIGRKLVALGKSAGYFQVSMDLRNRLGVAAYPKTLTSELLKSALFMDAWVKHWGFRPGMSFLGTLLADRNFAESPATAEEAEGFLAAMARLLPRQEAEDVFGDGLAHALSIAKTLTSGSPLVGRLLSLDRLLSLAEDRIVGLAIDRRESVLWNWYAQFSTTAAGPYFRWLVFRFSEKDNKIFEAVSSDFARINGSFSDEADGIVHSVTQLFLTKNYRAALSLISGVCRELEQRGIAKKWLNEKTLQLSLEGRLAPGCYQLETAKNMSVVSDKPLSASFASIITGSDGKVSLKAPRISLGPVILKSERRHPQVQVPPSGPEKNAVTFPLLLGLTAQRNTTYFAAGTHFFLYHYVYRDAMCGIKAPTPLSGFPGPDMELESETEVVHFPFVSLGGPGQQGAAPVRGGKGDKSFVDFDHIDRWLLAKADDESLKVKGPVRLEAKMNLEVIDDLANHADKTGEGKIIVITVPDYIEELPLDQKTKVVLACKEILAKPELEKSDLSTCIRSHLAVRAISEIEALLGKSRSDGSLRRVDMLSRLDPKIDFVLPDGGIGPENPDGPEGPPGELKITVMGAVGGATHD